MVRTRQIQSITRQDFDTSTLTVNYQTMAAGGLSSEVQIFKMLNSSTVAVDVSYDGTTDNERIPAGGSFVVDFSANSDDNIAALSKGTQVYLKGASAGTGSVYVMGYLQGSS